MIHFTPHQEREIVDIKCLYYQNSLVMWHGPLGPSNVIKRKRCQSTQIFLGQAPTINFLCYILLPQQLKFSVLPSSLLAVCLLDLSSDSLPPNFSSFSGIFQSLHWLHSTAAKISISYHLTSPLKSCPLPGYTLRNLPHLLFGIPTLRQRVDMECHSWIHDHLAVAMCIHLHVCWKWAWLKLLEFHGFSH